MGLCRKDCNEEDCFGNLEDVHRIEIEEREAIYKMFSSEYPKDKGIDKTKPIVKEHNEWLSR